MTNNIDSLRRYTKEELLFGIGYACTDTDVRIITSAIERKRMQDDLDKERRLLHESNDAFTAYSDFMRKRKKNNGGKFAVLSEVLMARQKMYFKWDMPTSIVEIVKAICADYDRRERAIKFGNVAGDVLMKYVELNNVINNALQAVEVGIRTELLRDIQNRRGYEHSAAALIIAKNTYYNRKKKLIYDIAKDLRLL